jgi:hypothetical protein
MSKTDKTTAATQASAVATLEPEITEPVSTEPILNDEGVLELSTEQFENFTAPSNTPLPTDVKHLLKKGVNLSHVVLEWKHFERTDEAQTRGFTVVRPDMHGKWFTNPDKAFNKQFNAVVRNIRGTRPELILCVRSKAWADREAAVMQALSDENTPTTAEKMQGILGGIAGQIGAENVRNDIKYVTGMKWGTGS